MEAAALLRDPERMKGVLREHLPGLARGHLVVEGCEIVHARYRTSDEDRRRGRPFLSICYELSVRDTGTRTKDQQVVHVRAYTNGRSRRRFEAAGDASLHLPELDAVLWAFPNDPRLAHLPDVIDPGAVRRHLPYDRLPPGFQSPADVDEVNVQVVRYKPEVRCTTRYRLRGGPAGAQRTLTLYGKTFRHDGAGEIARRMETLRAQLAGDPRGFIVPRPLGCDPSVKTVWQEGLPGTPLNDVIDAGNHRQLMDATARGLAGLHGVALEGLARTSLVDRLRAVRAETALLSQAFPASRARLRSVTSRVEKDAPLLAPGREGLVHGDFLLKQLVLSEGRLGVFDLDNLSVGDPIQDLANFIVDETRNLHHPRRDPRLVPSMVATFLDSYRSHTDWEVSAERLRWHARVQLLRDAYYWHKRKHLMPGFEDELQRMLDVAEDPPTDVD